MTPAETADRLVQYRLIPVIRYDRPEDAALAIECALRAGFPTVEITLTMPDALDLVREFSRHLESHQLVGAGTVWNETDCERVLTAGAACAFLCSVHAGYITGQNLLLDGGVYPGTF